MKTCIFENCIFENSKGCRVYNLGVYGISKCVKFKPRQRTITNTERFLECHYYEPKQELFESCPVRLHASDALTEYCINCPYNTFDPEGTRQFLLITATAKLKMIAQIIENVDERCMTSDGEITPTLKEMTQEEMSEIYSLATQTSTKVCFTCPDCGNKVESGLVCQYCP